VTAVLAAIAINVMPVAGSALPLAGTASAAVCTTEKHEAGWAATLLGSQQGAHQRWKTRKLAATDWNSHGGFAAEVLWVGTGDEDPSVDWVEVGATQGWEGQNLYELYTAHGHQSGAIYDENHYATVPPLGTSVTFTARNYNSTVPNSYIAEVSWSSGYGSMVWLGHVDGTIAWAGGSEATCRNNEVDRTYVSLNQYLSNGLTWITPAIGGLWTFNGAPAASAWCSQPVTFRYWQNSSIPTNVCS
jgi:hypothetical protein